MIGRSIGNTGVELSLLGVGAAPIGNLYRKVSAEDARATVDAAWDAGVRYFDTAPHYGLGLSECRLGAALAERPRADFVVSSKVGRLLTPNPNPTGSDLECGGFDVPDQLRREFDFSADGVRRSLDESLQRLGLDRLDIVYVHDPDDQLDQAIADAIPALNALRAEGVIGAVGVGMNSVDPLRRIVAESEVDLVMVAGRWTMIDRTAAPLLADCAERGVSVVAAAPFNSGLLASPWPAADATFNYGAVSQPVLERARSLARICRAFGIQLPHAAVQFPLQQKIIAGVVAGVRTPAQAISAADWAGTPLPDSFWAAIGELY